MPLLIALRKGGVKCSSACPFYTETGKVSGVRGVPLQTHCRMTMNPWMADCDIYNPCQIDKIEVSEDEWKAMLKSVHKRAIRQRKLYPEEHENANQVGCEWTRSKGVHNRDKSLNVKKIGKI
jgi:hypothetical protein